MRKSVFLFFTILFLSGCFSIPDSPNPRFYMLRGVEPAQITQTYEIPDIIVSVGPVKIPGYQNRPQIVTQDKNRMLKFSQFDRWGESLDSALARVITKDLSLMIPGADFEMFPSNIAIPVKYQVLIEFISLESELNKELFIEAQWSIIDTQKKNMLFTKKYEIRQEIKPNNYSGLAEALSAGCVQLSAQIAKSLADTVKQAPGAAD